MLSLPPDLCPTLPYHSLTTIHSAILNSCYILPHPCLSFCIVTISASSQRSSKMAPPIEACYRCKTDKTRCYRPSSFPSCYNCLETSSACLSVSFVTVDPGAKLVRNPERSASNPQTIAAWLEHILDSKAVSSTTPAHHSAHTYPTEGGPARDQSIQCQLGEPEMIRETMKRKRSTTRVSVPLVLCPKAARTQPTSRADLINGTNTTLALNFTKAYFKQWAVALLLMASEDGYKRQYRIALCIYRLYNKNMGVGLIVDLAYSFLESVPIRCEY
jgi:hypothetical protein